MYNAERQRENVKALSLFYLASVRLLDGADGEALRLYCGAREKLTERRGCHMKDYAASLYSSKAWQKTREAYKRSVGGLCEVCWAKGVVKPGEIVHHKQPITPENINDPEITLSFSNLQLVCREHHMQLHDRKRRRYKIDEFGRVECL